MVSYIVEEIDLVYPFNCKTPFQKIPFFAGVNSNFEMRLVLAIDSSYLQSLVYHFVANFILFLKIWGLTTCFLMYIKNMRS